MPIPFFGCALVHPVHNKIQGAGLTFQPLARIGVPGKVVAKATMLETVANEYPVKRSSRRAKIARPVRVRPSDPRDEHFEDVPVSVNASKDGIYFTSRRKSYYKGLRVFVTFAFSSPHDPMNCEYVADVVRVEELPNSKIGVAVHLKLSMNYSGSSAPGSFAGA
jgi:hypothetical protein